MTLTCTRNASAALQVVSLSHAVLEVVQQLAMKHAVLLAWLLEQSCIVPIHFKKGSTKEVRAKELLETSMSQMNLSVKAQNPKHWRQISMRPQANTYKHRLLRSWGTDVHFIVGETDHCVKEECLMQKNEL